MDASQVIAIATLVGGVGIVLSYFIGKRMGESSQWEEINNKQTWVDHYQYREKIYQEGTAVDATIADITQKRESLEFYISAYWYSDTGVRYDFTETFPAYDNFAEVSQRLGYIHSVPVFIIFTEEYPYYAAIMKRPW